jgi:hypothetical protein
VELNEIKKALYKQAPTAVFNNVTKDGILYSTELGEKIIYFRVPLSEVGDVAWTDKQESKLLIRYII